MEIWCRARDGLREADRHVSAVIICVYAIQKHLIMNTIETDENKNYYQQLIERSEMHAMYVLYFISKISTVKTKKAINNCF